MGLLSLHLGKVTQVQKKLVASSVFLKLVRPLVFSDPVCAENCVVNAEGVSFPAGWMGRWVVVTGD